ncbi:MAG: hypothetical protein IT548_17040 [Alphaproteobacteria bacterium]|nr:hypothetical protein [Alphaproteobacteria bacterium]
MANRMGVKEFRANFTIIAREAKAPIVVTNHDRVVGYYTPADKEPPGPDSFKRFVEAARRLRANTEARGIDVAARLKELGIEDDKPFDDPWAEGQPAKPTPVRRRRA